MIERGFGSYILQKKIMKKENDMKAEVSSLISLSLLLLSLLIIIIIIIMQVEIYRSLLQKYTLKGARDYLKLARRLEKEKRYSRHYNHYYYYYYYYYYDYYYYVIIINYEFLVEKMRETDNDLGI